MHSRCFGRRAVFSETRTIFYEPPLHFADIFSSGLVAAVDLLEPSMTKSPSSLKARGGWRGRWESGLPGDLPPIGLSDSLHRYVSPCDHTTWCLRQVASETATTTTTGVYPKSSLVFLWHFSRLIPAGSP